MKKIAIGFVIAVVAASPAMAKKMKHHRAAVEVASANPNENSWRLVRDGFPIFLPGPVIPFYLADHNQR